MMQFYRVFSVALDHIYNFTLFTYKNKTFYFHGEVMQGKNSVDIRYNAYGKKINK